MNLMAFDTMPGAPQGSFSERMRALRAAGFEGVQFAAPATSEQLQTCRELGLGVAASGRVNTPEEAGPLAEKFAADSYECATLHVGWGLEDDGEAGRLIESILAASAQFRFPLYIGNASRDHLPGHVADRAVHPAVSRNALQWRFL